MAGCGTGGYETVNMSTSFLITTDSIDRNQVADGWHNISTSTECVYPAAAAAAAYSLLIGDFTRNDTQIRILFSKFERHKSCQIFRASAVRKLLSVAQVGFKSTILVQHLHPCVWCSPENHAWFRRLRLSKFQLDLDSYLETLQWRFQQHFRCCHM